jgi:uncharacterized C2H2 Zn-finger protein
MQSKTQDLLRCDVCGATFRDSDALEKHRRVHEKAEDHELEQGTQQPMEHPTLPPSGFDTPVRAA